MFRRRSILEPWQKQDRYKHRNYAIRFLVFEETREARDKEHPFQMSILESKEI